MTPTIEYMSNLMTDLGRSRKKSEVYFFFILNDPREKSKYIDL